MSSNSPSILIITTTEGHLSLAQAAQDTLKTAQIACDLVLFEESVISLYGLVYRYRPAWFRLVFKLANSSFLARLATPFIRLHNHIRVKNAIKKYRPSIVINTSFSFTPALAGLKKKSNFKLINIVPNTYTFFWHDVAEAADINFVFDHKTQTLMHQLKPKANLTVSGWFVRDRFYSNLALADIRRKFALPELPTFLITSGSEGTQHVKDLVIKFAQENTQPVQLVVACGNNKALEKSLTAFAAHNCQEFPNSPTHIKVIGFTSELHEYMQLADLVVGKAGPNTVFEAVATITPFLVTTHVGGLEDGVLDVISEYQIGEIAEETNQAIAKMKLLLQNPERLETYKAACHKLAAHNKQASQFLLDYIASI